ncbi:MAG: hydrogenase maturation nickel metallochaperone HypA [Hyphomicrobium sp.]
MHELGITRNIVAIVSEHAAGRKVTRVLLDVGRLSGVMSDAIRFSFDVVSDGTCLKGARLDIRDIEGLGRCRRCNTEFATPTLFTPCACGCRDIERVAGEELKVCEFEFETAPIESPRSTITNTPAI